MLGTLMDSEKTGEIVSREEIFKKLKKNEYWVWYLDRRILMN
jgi:hypothetical protein